MTGVKGKSGKVTTLEQRKARVEVARLGGLAAQGKRRASKDETRPPRPQAPGAAAEFPVEGWIDLKDRLACDLARRKIEQADIDVATSRVAYEKARGKLVPEEDVAAGLEGLGETVRGTLATALPLVASLVPPDQILAATKRTEEWAAAGYAQFVEAMAAVQERP
jgi:hypothetical protein